MEKPTMAKKKTLAQELDRARELFTAACLKKAEETYNCFCDGCVGKISGFVASDFLLDVMSMDENELETLKRLAP